MRIFLIFGIIMVVATLLFEKYIVFGSEISGANKIYRIIEEETSNEIALLGSSRAQGSYVPSVISDQLFNYGIDGIQDNVVLLMLEEELKKDKDLPVIINFDLDGINTVTGDDNNYIPMIWNEKIYDLVKDNLSYYQRIPIIKYFGKFEFYFKLYLNNKINLTKKTDNGGSYEIDTDLNALYAQIERRKQREVTITDDTLLVNQYISLIESTDRKLVFVVAPFHVAYFREIVNEDDGRLFLKRVDKYENVTVFDMSNQSYPDSLYVNITHLNYTGAVQFSKCLKDSLIKYNIIDGK